MNGEFDKISGSATAYAWFVWVKGYQGETFDVTLSWGALSVEAEL